jgi:hypothetical protein
MPYSAQTLSSLNGNFKQTHLKKLEKLVNEDTHLFKDIPFDESTKEGALFRQPVYLTRPHGITFSASDSAPTLAAPIAAETKELSFDAFQMIMRERVSYDAADRMKSKESYISATGELPMWLRLAHIHYAEMMLWYGQHADGVGTVASISGNVLTITTAQWAPQIWQGAENMRLDVYTGSTYVKTVQVTAYNLDSMTVTVDSSAGITAADALHPAGSYGNSYRGIVDVITETTSQFGQNPSTYNLLRGVEQTASSGTLKFKTIQWGLAKARAKGLSKRAKLYCSEFTFPDFVEEVDAARTDPQRSGDMRGTQIERGADNVKIHSPNGTLEVQVSSYCKKGLAPLLIQDGSWTRKGTSDVTFKIPGSDGEFYLHLQEVAGYELRSWSNFANYTPRAGSNTLYTNIVNGIDGGT